MTDGRCARPMEFVEVVDYWAGDLSREELERIEEHVFACSDCARRLAEGEELARGIAAVVREGRFHATATDAVLNRLARDGVRIRSFAVEPGGTVQCAVWADDDLIVAHMRGDFSDVDSATVVTRLATGEELDRLTDIPVRPGQHEIVDAISASFLRQLPSTTVRITIVGQVADAERTIGEYVLEHGGAFDRSRS